MSRDLVAKIKLQELNGGQEEAAIRYFRQIVKMWRTNFTEDNWPTTADYLHEMLHRAMIAEGCKAEWIEFLAHSDWKVSP
jgi:hypothetical protein